MKPSELLKQATAILEDGVKTRDAYRAAVPLIFDLREQAKSLGALVKSLRDAADDIGEGAAAYAIDHATALDAPLAQWKDGIERGTVEIDGRTYALTISDGDVRRISGGNLTQGFLAGLPDDWTAKRLELRKSALRDATADELEGHDLLREKDRDWSLAEAGR